MSMSPRYCTRCGTCMNGISCPKCLARLKEAQAESSARRNKAKAAKEPVPEFPKLTEQEKREAEKEMAEKLLKAIDEQDEEPKVYAPCLHTEFVSFVDVTRMSDPSQPLDFHADLKIVCKDCGCKFRFLGLPAGFAMKGASVSFDGTEARLAIEPVE